jgi:CubicO group peptidase (beta-lactamase class C family)
MRRLALAILVPAALAAQAPNVPVARVDSVFAFATSATPGCAVAAAQNGALRFAKGYGIADLEHGVPITPATPFYLASVSKQFTAAAVNLLALDGKLSLDDDVRKYVPEVPAYGAPITLRHLVHHTSGLRDYLTLFALRDLSDHPITNAEFLETVARQRALNFPTGAEYSYSNTGYVLLSIVVERVSGKSLRDFARERLFVPLGMSSTQFRDRHDLLVPGRALAYGPRPEGGYRLSVPYFDVVGDGGLFSTVEDLAKWEANFWDPRVGGAAWLEREGERGRLNDGTALDYGAGLAFGTYRGEPVVSHGGSLGGYNTHLLRFPARRFSVAVLCNDNARPSAALARQVADAFLPDLVAADRPAAAAAAPPPAVTPASAESVERYAGVFFNDRLMQVLSVVAQNGALYGERGPGSRVDLRPAGPGRFQVAPTATVAFSPRADTLRVENVGGLPSVYRRVARTRPVDPRAYAGGYASDELGVAWRVDAAGERDSALVLRSPRDSVRLEPAFDDAFRGGGMFVRFARDKHGRVTDMLVSAGERVRNVPFVRR